MERQQLIDQIRSTPNQVRDAVAGLSSDQLTTPYRDGGWTPTQIVHHLADSHMHAYLRTKLMMTEDHPTLKPYDQDVWAKLPDAKEGDISTSLSILDGLHARWTSLFDALHEEDWKRSAYHPERGTITVQDMLEIYAGHGTNHTKQIESVKK